MDYVFFEFKHIEDFSKDEIDDCIFKGFIDGYPEHEYKEGTTIVSVSITYSGDIVIDWHHNAYKLNDRVLKLIKEARTTLTNGWIMWVDEIERSEIDERI